MAWWASCPTRRCSSSVRSMRKRRASPSRVAPSTAPSGGRSPIRTCSRLTSHRPARACRSRRPLARLQVERRHRRRSLRLRHLAELDARGLRRGQVIAQRGLKVGVLDVSIPFGSEAFSTQALAAKSAGVNAMTAEMDVNSNIALLTALKQNGVNPKVVDFATGYSDSLSTRPRGRRSRECCSSSPSGPGPCPTRRAPPLRRPPSRSTSTSPARSSRTSPRRSPTSVLI